MNDPFHLQRFVDAQNPVYGNVLEELRAGCKRSHWMWFIFPQLAGLGSSSMARKFGISSLKEAEAYLNHEVLGFRLRECSALAVQINDRTAHQIFGDPDDMKFRSCMTLFARTTQDNQVFQEALLKYFAGAPDPRTQAALEL